MDNNKRLQEIKEAIIIEYPEFAPLLIPLDFVEKEMPGARMATDGRCIYYSPSFVNNTDDAQVAVSMVHEAGHCGLQHLWYQRTEALIGAPPAFIDIKSWQQYQKNKQKVDIAADLALNPLLKAAGFNLKDRIYQAEYEGMSLEEIFHKLPNQAKDKDNHDDCALILIEGDPNSEENQKLRQQWQQAFAEFITLARVKGTLPETMLQELSKIRKPKISWIDLLASWVVQACGKEEYTWKKPSRRGLAVDLYLPSQVESCIQNLGFGSDTSGSMSQEDCTKAILAVVSAAKAVKIRKFVWVEGDTIVQRVLEFEESFNPPKDIKGRGGTDFRPILAELMKHDPICIVYFTDLAGTRSEEHTSELQSQSNL